jgi:MFS family permease
VVEPVGTFSPLRHAAFRAMWASNLLSQMGTMIQVVGAAWLMTTLSRSANMVALVQTLTSLPIVLFSLAAGAIADLYDERRVMIAAQSCMVLTSIVIGEMAWTRQISSHALLGLMFLMGCGAALNNPAWQASIREQVHTRELGAAIALNSVALHVARSVGPAIGGLIVSGFGAFAAFFANVLCSIVQWVVVLTWRRPAIARTSDRFAGAVGAGLRYAWGTHHIRSVLIRGFAFSTSGCATWALMPLVARDLQKGGVVVFGALAASFGLGSLALSVCNTRIRNSLSLEAAAIVSTVALSGVAFVTAARPPLPIAEAALFVAGGSWVLSGATFSIAVQTASPRNMAGRAVAMYQTFFFGGMALGSWTAGELTDSIGLPRTLCLSGLALLFSLLLRMQWPLS